MADAIRVRICEQNPRLYIVDTIRPDGKLGLGLLSLEGSEIDQAIEALQAAKNEPRASRMVYVVSRPVDGLLIDRGEA